MFVLEFGLVPNPLVPMGIRGLFIAIVVNVVLFVGISYLTAPPEKAKVEQFHGLINERLREAEGRLASSRRGADVDTGD